MGETLSDLLTFSRWWPLHLALLLMDFVATAHIVLTKRDSRVALGWVGLIWFVPAGGAVLYFLFGINRIHRKAKRLRRKRGYHSPDLTHLSDSERPSGGVQQLMRAVGRIADRPVVLGNSVQTLSTGRDAYDSMTAAIASAEQSIGLSTYIFDSDASGRRFVEALEDAVRRDVEVKVLIDDVGSRYSFPSIFRLLRRANVPAARFMPSLFPWQAPYAQLRNHRKLLIVDGRIGFTGGMNIRDGHDATTNPRHPIVDSHVRVEGPVVADMRSVFADDWHFTTGERLSGDSWHPHLVEAGAVCMRGVASGPDDLHGRLRLTYLAALACAEHTVRIVTPYFLPDVDLVAALNVAAIRGVKVDVLVPEVNNLQLVHWAMMGQLQQLLEFGVRVWLTPPPFDHTKWMVVDRRWCLIGSANWDPRSLRLNFEYDLECYGASPAEEYDAVVDRRMRESKRLTESDLRNRNLFVRLRDGVARLASPYL